MDPAYFEFPFAVPIYGRHGPSNAHALISVPMQSPEKQLFPVILLLEGRAHLYKQDSSGRQLFDKGVTNFILVTPKIGEDGDSALLSRTNSQEDWRFAEDALCLLLQESLFEIERVVAPGVVDFSRIYCTGYSIGGDSCFGFAAQPGVGRLLAGLVPFACKGEESMLYTTAGLDEFKGLRIWGVQNATERNDWKMHRVVQTLAKLVDGAQETDREEDTPVPFEAAWIEGEGQVRKYKYGQKEVWEIADSQSSTWTERGLRYKHHDCWTTVMKHGVLGRFVTSWMFEGRNPHVDVMGELSYKLVLRRPVCKCVFTIEARYEEAVPWEHVETTKCNAQRLGVWASPDGVVGANIPCRDACAPAHGKSIWVGDKIHSWKVDGRFVHLSLHRGQHLIWKPTAKRLAFEGAIYRRARDADYLKWFVEYEDAKQICFRQRCLGNFQVAIEWANASVADFSQKAVSPEEDSTAAETLDESTSINVDHRLRAQADKEKRVFLASPFWTSMLCRSALKQLLAEYKCQLPEHTDFQTKTRALREAAKNKWIHEEFYEQPWRWVNRIRRVLRDARQPWLQMTVVNDRTGLDKAGVPVTKKRIGKVEETEKDCDLFCFLEEGDEGRKVQRELFVGLKSEVARQFPDKYKLWVRPKKTSEGKRYCEYCAESETRRHLATSHDGSFCKFVPKAVRCAAA